MSLCVSLLAAAPNVPIAASLERYMDLLAARQKLVAANLANIDTPGYKAKDIDFQREFASQLAGQAPEVIASRGLRVKPDGNNVDVDRESRMLAENAIRFNLASTLLKSEFKAVRDAIHEGKA